ncbi:MAG: NADH:flavin oxidoreductase/NADH oxidase [Treponema sp.]|nr:NADH:flavin oxidoreductase/NADH oxidase [Treponema sp.]
MSKLFESFSLKNLTIRNRIVMPPMCMYEATEGFASDFHVMHYGARALGGAGLVIVEATGVVECGRITDNCLGIYDDAQIPGLARIAAAIKANGAAPAIQLGHAGRKCVAQVPEVFAPSALPFDPKDPACKIPRAMSGADIEAVVEAFKNGARRAAQAGFEMIEIHGAHGYLLSSFLSPLANKRDDEYGSCMGNHGTENRSRIVGRVLAAAREAFPGPICLRVSAEDYAPEGNRPADIAEMLNLIKAQGIDIVNVSSGGVSPAAPRAYPGYQVKFAEIIREATGLPVMAGGLLSAPEHMEEIIANERADMVYVGRELLRNPHFPLLAASRLGADFPWPKQYERARPR